MIILFNRSGQTCNQWMAFISCLANAHQNKQKLVYPLMDSGFESIFHLREEALDGVKVKIFNNNFLLLLSKIIVRIGYFFNIKTQNPKWEDRDKKLFFLWDWSCSVDYSAMRKAQDYIINVLVFEKEVVKKVNMWWEDNIGIEKKTIAVHLRRGDYRDFSGGKYYYSNEEYLNWMKNLIFDKDKFQFLLFSNEIIEEDVFKALPIIVMKGNTAEDLYAMSKCDYIMGPPSSFSRCAAYMGKKKRLVLLDKNKRYSISDFCESSDIKFYESHADIMKGLL